MTCTRTRINIRQLAENYIKVFPQVNLILILYFWRIAFIDPCQNFMCLQNLIVTDSSSQGYQKRDKEQNDNVAQLS